MLEFTQCMRSRGVSGFPEPIARSSVPPGGGNHFLGNGPNPATSPTFQAAERACRKYAVATKVTPAGAAEVQAEMLKYAQCMRTQGVIDFPEPSANGGFTIPKPVDENGSSFRSAERACKGLLLGLPGSSG
jgi:hypothetical protein